MIAQIDDRYSKRNHGNSIILSLSPSRLIKVGKCIFMKRFVKLLSVLVLVCVFSASAGALTFTTIDYPDAVETVAYGINDRGEIVGKYADSSGDLHGFLAE